MMAVHTTPVTPEELKMSWELLSNWEWRINNLYYVVNKDGKKVRFRLNRAQLRFFRKMWYRNVILKARQLGFTTFMLIFMLDACLFTANTRCALVADNRENAKRLFSEKVMFAYDSLDPELKAVAAATNKNANELVFANKSKISVGTSYRGGTLKYLHISEMGKICKKYPAKAQEIVTGSFEAVGKNCVITLESTAEGKTGYFHQYATDAEKLALAGTKLSQLDWKFFFYPWYEDPDYLLDEAVPIPQRLVEYFYALEQKHRIKTTAPQQWWYVKKEAVLGDKMKQEYPSTPEEAFEQSIEGAYYARQFLKLYERRQICKVPHEPAVAVHTIWDIGHSDSTAIWFVQLCGREWHVIDYYQNDHEGLDHYVKILQEKKEKYDYHYGTHIGPHDMAVHEWGADGKTRWEQAKAKGITFTIAPSISLSDGIEAVRTLLPTCWFDEEMTEEGYSLLQEYRKEWDVNHGYWKDNPLHDHTSHCADGFRYFAVATNLLVETYSTFGNGAVIRQQPIPTSAWT